MKCFTATPARFDRDVKKAGSVQPVQPCQRGRTGGHHQRQQASEEATGWGIARNVPHKRNRELNDPTSCGSQGAE